MSCTNQWVLWVRCVLPYTELGRRYHPELDETATAALLVSEMTPALRSKSHTGPKAIRPLVSRAGSAKTSLIEK